MTANDSTPQSMPHPYRKLPPHARRTPSQDIRLINAYRLLDGRPLLREPKSPAIPWEKLEEQTKLRSVSRLALS
jgi:hypothetical protein